MLYTFKQQVETADLPVAHSTILSKVYVCSHFCLLGFNCGFNIGGHIMTVPACSSGTLTNVLTH